MQHWNYANKAKLKQKTKQKLTKTLSPKCKQVKMLSLMNNLKGPTIMEDVEPNVQRHVKTQLENSRLVFIIIWSIGWNKFI